MPRLSEASAIALFWKLVAAAPRMKAVLVLAVASSLTEGFGIVLLVPLLAAMAGDRAKVRWLRDWLPDMPVSALLTVVLLLIGVRALVRTRLAFEMARQEYGVVDQLRTGIHAGLHRAEWRWLSQQRSADHVTMLVSNIGKIGQGLREALAIVGLASSACIYGLIALFLSWQTALVALFAGGLILLLSGAQRRRSLAFGQTLSALNNAVHRKAQESVTSIRTSKILCREDAEIAALNAATDTLRTAQFDYIRQAGRTAILSQIASALAVVGTFAFGSEVAHLGLAQLVPMLFVLVRIVPMLVGIQNGWRRWLEVAPVVQGAHALLEALDQAAERHAGTGAGPPRVTKAVRLEQVVVRFDARKAPALDTVSVTFPACATTAIMGPSGSGKSTLSDVLMGLIVPDAGSIHVDDVEITDVLRRQWRSVVAYVEQRPMLLHGSIRENLLVAMPGASEGEMVAALTAASAEFVLALPDGIDTQIGDDGIRLSGGERQRIALAKALLRQPELLILDEATNALDRANEAAVRHALQRLRGTMTIVIITHDETLVESVDQVVRLLEGRVVSRGGGPRTQPIPG